MTGIQMIIPDPGFFQGINKNTQDKVVIRGKLDMPNYTLLLVETGKIMYWLNEEDVASS